MKQAFATVPTPLFPPNDALLFTVISHWVNVRLGRIDIITDLILLRLHIYSQAVVHNVDHFPPQAQGVSAARLSQLLLPPSVEQAAMVDIRKVLIGVVEGD